MGLNHNFSSLRFQNLEQEAMAGMQLASFLFEMACSPPRSPKAPFSAVAPWQVITSVRRQARTTLDPIVEEDGFDSLENNPHIAIPSSSSSADHFHIISLPVSGAREKITF